ncbi:MAG: CvpA family protein [Bacteroidota bacterium]
MVIDIIFVIVLLSGFYVGFARGIIQAVFTVLSLLFGLMAAFRFSEPTKQFLETTFKSENPLMFVAGFLLSFVVTMFIIRTIARFLEGALKTANINIINKMAGGMLLSAIMILVLSVLLWFGDQARMLDAKTKQESMTYSYLEQYPDQLKIVGKQLKPMLYNFWDQSMNMMDRLEQISIEQTENTKIEDRSDELPPKEEAQNN